MTEIHDVRDERVGQDVPGRLLVDPSGPEVEHGVVVELSNRRGVIALHVIGEDLEAGRAIDERLVGEEEVLVRLAGDRLLRVLADVDVPVEHPTGLVVEDAPVQLDARARSSHMIDPRVVVVLLRPRRHEHPVERELAAFPAELREHGVP